MSTGAKYSEHLDYLIASIIYLATQQGWWARTATKLGAELSLDVGRLSYVFEAFPGLFRKSHLTDEEGQHFYALQARYATRTDYQTGERTVDIPPLPMETVKLIYDFVLKAADDERARHRNRIGNAIAVAAAVLSALTAMLVATMTAGGGGG